MNVNQLFSRLRRPSEGRMPALDGTTAWLNTEPLAPTDLHGKVVTAQFWTYTCINWLRTLPYIRAWADTYVDMGLVVVGVHTPEFTVEHDVDCVRRAGATCGSTIRSQSTTTTPSGRHLRTTTGRRSTSPTPRAVSATTTSVKVATNARSTSSASCCWRPVQSTCRHRRLSRRTASNFPRTGTTFDLPRRTSASHGLEVSCRRGRRIRRIARVRGAFTPARQRVGARRRLDPRKRSRREQ